MPVCRMCTQNYPNSQFVSGNGPRYQVCVRCATENDMLAEGSSPILRRVSSDHVPALFARRFRPWGFLLAGWLLFFSFGTGIELWSNLFTGHSNHWHFSDSVLHFMGSTKFRAELAALTP